jgi:1-phosphofructokinase family hexose kinase
MLLCLGTTPVFQRSMVFDRVTPDAVNRARQVWDYASGKSVNVARVLHSLGGDALATGFAGGDRGAAMLRDLDAAGVRHDFVTVDAPTRQCVTVIDRAAGTATELVEESHPVAADDWDRLGTKLDQLLPSADAFILSGSLPPGADDGFYLQCLRRARAPRPRVIILDTRGEPLRRALAHDGPFVVKLNRDELAVTVAAEPCTDDEVLRAMRQITPAGGAAVTTSGAHGILASDSQHRAWRLRPPTVRADSAVGSGDAFAAGLAVATLDGQPLPHACVLAAACGAANAMTPLAGHLRATDVQSLATRVSVEDLTA